MELFFSLFLILTLNCGGAIGNNACKEKWELVFHAPSGNGENVLKAWQTKHGSCDIVSGKCQCSMKNGCLPYGAKLEKFRPTRKILRSPYLDFWNCLNIKKIKVELNSRGKTLAFIEFNGQGSSIMNWFQKSNILNSSWSDVDKSGKYNVFSIDQYSNQGRNFFINKNYGGCSVDAGWLVVTDAWKTKVCKWSKQTPYPQFMYSKIGKATKWNDMKYGKADVFNIYIQRG